MHVKKCINDNKSKLLFRFGHGKWIGVSVYCANKVQSSASLLDSSRNRNNTVCEYVKSNIEEFQKSSVSCLNSCTIKRITRR